MNIRLMTRRMVVIGAVLFLCAAAYAWFNHIREQRNPNPEIVTEEVPSVPQDFLPVSGTVTNIDESRIVIQVDRIGPNGDSQYVVTEPQEFTITKDTNIVVQPRVAIDAATGSVSEPYLGDTKDVPIGARVSVLYSASDTSDKPIAWRILTLEQLR